MIGVIDEVSIIAITNVTHFILYNIRTIFEYLSVQVNAKMLNNIIEEEDDCFVFFYEEMDPEASAILAELEGSNMMSLSVSLLSLFYLISSATATGIVALSIIKMTRRYGPLRGPTSSSCGGLQPLAEGFFCPLGKKRAYYAVLAHFCQFFVSSSNLGNF